MTRRIPAVFMRGGSSKGVMFLARDLPDDPAARDALLLRVLGSPDPYGRQLDGMGGGLSSLSKAALIAPSARTDADVDFTFAQVAVDRPVVDYGATCGNLASAVGGSVTASPTEIERDGRLMALLDRLRRAGGVRMGLGRTPEEVGLANPKIAMIGPPTDFETIGGERLAADSAEIAVRIISMEKCHRAVTLTGAMCVAVATRVGGSLPHALARVSDADIRVANPSGVLPVSAAVRHTADGWQALSARVYRTARRLMVGEGVAGQ